MSPDTAPPRVAPRPLRLERRTLTFEVPRLMGILNCTPDSFSDGGRHLVAEDAIASGLRMVEAGAAVLDVGGESTRPGADPVPLQEELRRVIPVIEGLRANTGALISVDTTKASVAEAALTAGADLVNDVSAMRWDPDMVGVVASRGAGCVLMHTRGTPETMMTKTDYGDVVAEVAAHLERRRLEVIDAGIEADRIVLDPGIGFAKGLGDNLSLIRRASAFGVEGAPVLIGPSRKRFIGELTGVSAAADRLSGTLGAVVAAALYGAALLRVHDVEAAHRAVVVATAVRDA